MSSSRRTSVALAAIFLIGVAIRLWWADAFAAAPAWNDPDGYLDLARVLDDGTRPWRWTIASVQWIEFYKAPLYQTVLSFFTGHPALFPQPLTAFVFDAVMNGSVAIALYSLGSSLHSRRAGWIAAIAWMIWAPNILISASLWQEHLSTPLFVIGVAILARGIDAPRPVWFFGLAGAALGLSALTRSVVAYFIPIVLAVVVLGLGRTQSAVARAGGVLLGFLATTLPYVVLISMTIGRFMFIEDSGTVALKRMPAAQSEINIVQFMKDPNRGPTASEAARYVLADLSRDPAGFIARKLDHLRLFVKPAGASMLPQLSAPTAAGALLRKAGVHLWLDATFTAALLLAPFGVILARSRGVGWLLGLWIVAYLAILSMTLWAGTRYRSPVEPIAIVLAAVVAAGGWERPRRAALAVALAIAAFTAIAIGLSVPATLAARANYGIAVWNPPQSTETTMGARAGLNVLAGAPALAFTLTDVSETPAAGSVTVALTLDGEPGHVVSLAAGETARVDLPVAETRLHYLELAATSPDGRVPKIQLRLVR